MTITIKSPKLPWTTHTHVDPRTLQITAEAISFHKHEPGHRPETHTIRRHAGLEIELKFDHAKED